MVVNGLRVRARWGDRVRSHSVRLIQSNTRRHPALEVPYRGDPHSGETTDRDDENGDHDERQQHFRGVRPVLAGAGL